MENETNTNVTTELVGAEEESKGKFYTEEEIALIEQKAGDKRISQYQKTMEKKQRESDKLRNMSEEDKRDYNLSKKEEELAAREEALLIAENKAECLSILAEKGLDVKLVDFVVDSDATVMYDKIKNLEKCFKASVKAEIEKRIGNSSPKKNPLPEEGMTRDTFNKLSLHDLQEFADANPALVKQFFN